MCDPQRWGYTSVVMADLGSAGKRVRRRRKVSYRDAEGRPTDDPAKAVQGEVLEYGAHLEPARRTPFFLGRSELPWLPVSEPAFLLWVLALLFMVWLAIGLFLLT
jgi:hypothetical protein